MPSIAEIRARLGAAADGVSDAELFQVAEAAYAPLYADKAKLQRDLVGDNAGKWGNRLSASVDSYQGNLYGLAEAATGSDWAKAGRQRNENDAEFRRMIAQRQGAVMNLGDISGVGDFFDYAGGLAVDSLPYLGEAVVGGGVGGLAARGLGLGAKGALAARTAGAVGASYPSAVGDILSNQREAGDGDTMNLGAAAAGGVPYAALNAFGLEGALARRGGFRTAMKGLDEAAGPLAMAKRVGANAGIGFVSEGASEAGQEVVNQGFGRMVADPNETLFSPDALARYGESFVGGGILGGMASGVAGVRRTQPGLPLPQPKTVDEGTTDLLAPDWTTSQGFDARAMREAIDAPLGDLTPSWETALGAADPAGYEALDPAGLVRPFDEAPVTTGRERAELQMPVVAGLPGRADSMLVGGPGEVALTDADNEAMLDPGAAEARRRYLEQRAAEQAKAQAVKEAEAKFTAQRQAAVSALVDTDPKTGKPMARVNGREIKTFTAIEQLAADGKITPEQRAELVGEMRDALKAADTKTLADVAKRVEALNTPAAPATQGATNVGVPDVAGRGAGASGAAGGAVAQGSVDGAGRDPAAAVGDAAPANRVAGNDGQVRAVANGPAGGPTTAVIGGSIDFDALNQLITDPRMRKAIRLHLGVDSDGTRIPPISQRAAAEVAGIGANSHAAVNRALKAAGITKAVLNRFLASDATASADATPDADAPQVDQEILDATQTVVADESDLQDAGFGAASSAGGATSNVDAGARGRLDKQAWWPKDGKFAQLSHKQFATIAAKAIKFDSPSSAAAYEAVMREAARRANSDPSAFKAEMDAALRAESKNRSKGEVAVKEAASEDTEEDDSVRGDLSDDEAGRDVEAGRSGGSEGVGGGAGEGAGSKGPAPKVVVKKKRTIQKSQRGDSADDTYTKEDLEDDILSFVNAESLGRRVIIVDTAADLRRALSPELYAEFMAQELGEPGSAVAFAADGRAYMVADRIQIGEGRAVFMHEVGGHIGLERMLGKEQFARLARKVQDWAARDDGSQESEIAKKALERAASADSAGDPAEHVAYFLEEAIKAGVRPTALKLDTEMGRWVRAVWAAFKSALRKLGVKLDTLTGQDLVDLAYGAARLQVAGRWHGTAADVHQFRNTYIGTGEGAQAYGWGQYFSAIRGVAADYKKSDVKRKTSRSSGYDGVVLANGKQLSGPTNWWANTNGLTEGFVERTLAKDWEQKLAKLEAEATALLDKRRELDAAATATSAEYDAAVKERFSKGVTDPEFDSVLERIQAASDKRRAARDARHEFIMGQSFELASAQSTLEHIKEIRDGGGLKSAVAATPKGNLYGVDFAVPETSFLSWTDPIRKQPRAVKEALDRLHEILSDSDELETYEDEIRRDFDDWTGQDIIKHVGPKMAFDDLLPAGSKEIEDALAQGNDAKATSLFLDSIGVHGVRVPVNHTRGGTFESGSNFVVFNDKNVIRAVNNPESNSKSGLQFSKAAKQGEATLDQVDRLNAQIAASMDQRARSAFTNISDAIKRYTPAWLTNFQLAEQFGKQLPALRAFVGLQQKMTVERMQSAQKVSDVAHEWEKLPQAENARLSAVMQDATMQGIHPDLKFDDALNAHLTPADRAKYDALATRYKALTPAAKDVYARARDALDEQWKGRQAAYQRLVTNMYDERVAEAKAAGADEAAIAEIEKARTDAIEQYGKQLGKIKGPYFPLLRFGEYLAIGKSAQFEAAQDAYETATGKDRERLEKELDKLKADPKHYVVAAYDNRAEQLAAIRKIKADGLTASEDLTDIASTLNRASRDTIEHYVEGIRKEMDPGVAAEMNAALTQVFLKTLPEMSALRREIERKNVTGASADMLRSFAAAGSQGAFYTSRLLYAKEIANALQQIKHEARGSVDMAHVSREMQKRAALDMSYKETPIQDAISTASWVYHLGLSPSFMLMNMTQPLLTSLPVMAGKHGSGPAFSALKRSYTDALKMLKAARFKESEDGKGSKWDAWSGVNEATLGDRNERIAIREMLKRGIVDEGMQHELNMFADDKSRALAKINRYSGWGAQQIELVNRLSTALAAYRLALPKMGHDAAIDYAYATTVKTQMDYSAEGTARVMREGGGVPLARLVFQFRRYQQGMLYLLIDNVKKIGDPAERKEALQTLKYLTFAAGMSAGAMGLPFVGTAFMLANAFMDDDDDRGDAETRFRNLMHDTFGKEMGTVLSKGLPAMFGADLSQRIGLGDIATPFPMARFDGAKTGRDATSELLFNLVGPAGGLASQLYDGTTRIANGDLMKGLEKLSPKVIADLGRGARYATEGMTDSKGEKIPNDIGGWEVFLRSVGVQSTTESNYYEGTQAIQEIRSAQNSRKDRISAAFKNGLQDGDMAKARELIAEWNADHPNDPIRPKDELAWRKQVSRSEKQRGDSGVKVDPKRDKGYAETARFAQ